jgi:RNA polymerase sigma-70 factor (ECF subfamily)
VHFEAAGLSTDTRAALRAAYLERRNDLVRFFTLRLGSAAAAEDLVQDVFLRIERIDPKSDVQNPAGYLYRLGSNLMLDRLRTERRAASRDLAWRQAHRTIVGKDEIDEAPAVEDALSARQRLAAIVRALSELPPQTQRVFRMHKFEGLSHPEVAAALGISRSAVEKHVMAALKHLAALP